ncbi:uncharacterized protein [Drosophila pseudoobscura]|uniref:Uncharacterized protein n=1 Tax=Drosophila pseudoobscura pseudoobscura TaxID=46245 RepID=A0A6I8USS5_DROPS|nr:uncharacterized protein LOC4803638 [Drosophila pseudoobscura]
MLQLDSKNGVILSGVLSVVFATVYILLKSEYFWYISSDLGLHVSALQIMGSICLVIGAIKNCYKLFVPWMITCGFFLYLMVYLGVAMMVNGYWLFLPIMVVPFTAYLSYALFSVQKAFDRMRKEEPPSYENLVGKKDFIGHI